MNEIIWVVSYGGGTNSTAVLIGMWKLGIRPALIMFADTGNEKPETYRHLEVVQKWLKSIGWPPITIVRNELPKAKIDGSLYGECLRLGTLPSKTFGYSNCSVKWKVEPQRKHQRKWMRENNIEFVHHVIGYDADEIERSLKFTATDDYEQRRYLLIEWNWGRDECIGAIQRVGMSQPGKSACFMCPSSKKPEVLELKRVEPDLYHKAIVLERRALAGEGQAPAARVSGLGRHWNWETFAGSDIATPEIDCGCFDG